MSWVENRHDQIATFIITLIFNLNITMVTSVIIISKIIHYSIQDLLRNSTFCLD